MTHRSALIAPVAPVALVLALAAGTALAQDAERGGVDLLELGGQLLLRGIISEMSPALDELQGELRDGFDGELFDGAPPLLDPALRRFAAQIGPALGELMAALDDVGNYEAPVILDNGDILIRRRADAPPYAAPEDATPGTPQGAGEIDL